jgi:hypothetical protein
VRRPRVRRPRRERARRPRGSSRGRGADIRRKCAPWRPRPNPRRRFFFRVGTVACDRLPFRSIRPSAHHPAPTPLPSHDDTTRQSAAADGARGSSRTSTRCSWTSASRGSASCD